MLQKSIAKYESIGKVLEKCSSIAKYERFAKSIANIKVLQKVL